MRYYKKQTLLMFFLSVTCLSKIVFGVIYFIEDKDTFFIVAAIARIMLGFSFCASQPIAISYIPEIWPEATVKYMSYYQICFNCGLFIGPIFGAVLSLFFNFFWVFFVFSALHLVIGLLLIWKFLDINIVQFSAEEEKSLEVGKIICDGSLIIQFFFQTLFLGGIIFIYSSFENHIIKLSGYQFLCSIIYGLDMVGFLAGAIIIKKFNKNDKVRKVWFLCGGILLIVFNNFMGPAPFLNITDDIHCLVSIAIAFFINGIGMSIMAPFFVPEYTDLLRNIFPDKKQELLTDMASAIYNMSYTTIELTGTILGGVTIDNLGFEWANSVYSGCLLLYFIIYWTKRTFFEEDRENYQSFSDEK